MEPLNTITILGVGLIGGSIGLAVRRRGLARRVIGVGRRRASLELAEAVGAVTESTTDLAAGVAEAELIVVCSPVGLIAEHVRACAEHAPEGTLITDAGSTKRVIVESLDAGLPRGCRFVGSHPLAGSEKTGPGAAADDLFEGRVTVLTPTERTPPRDIETLETFWAALGSWTVRMSPDEHDRVLARTSHLPHAVAVALAAVVEPEEYPLSGTGFRDTSRLAAGDPTLWTQIFAQNGPHVVAALRAYEERLAALRVLIERQQTELLFDFLTKAKNQRDALGS